MLYEVQIPNRDALLFQARLDGAADSRLGAFSHHYLYGNASRNCPEAVACGHYIPDHVVVLYHGLDLRVVGGRVLANRGISLVGVGLEPSLCLRSLVRAARACEDQSFAARTATSAPEGAEERYPGQPECTQLQELMAS